MITGKVIKGAGRGRDMGFPTANLDIENIEAEEGIWIGYADKKPALIFIGAAKTFGETQKRAEVYLLDFDGDLYGQEIAVELIEKIRENNKFDNPGALIEQMKQDEITARKYFKL